MPDYSTKKELREIIAYEKRLYSEYMFRTKRRYFLALIKREPARIILNFQILCRKTDYYKIRVDKGGSWTDKIAYFYYVTRRNRLGEKLSMELNTRHIEKGLIVYHYGITVNARMGEHCHLHGDNCIGNAGPDNLKCPVLGKNVMVGVGAKLIGDIYVADNIKIAAGAVVVTSFTEPGITIGGVPAKKLK